MKISGIYQMQSKIKPIRIYIGSAVNINDRWRCHLKDLKKQKHHSKKLQNHYNKYGESDLQFSILLGCEISDLIRIEQYFLDSHNPYFNTCKIAGSCLGIKRSKETRQKQSLLKKDKPLSEEHRNAIIESKRNVPNWNKGNKGYRAGRKESKETCEKHRLVNLRLGLIPPSQKGHKRSEEWKQKRRATFLKKKMNKMAS
jgi:group I intron endonuclease